MRLCSKSASCNQTPQLFLKLQSFSKKAAIITATHGQKTALNKRMEKIEMEYGPFICTIICYLIICIRFRKELPMLSLPSELLTFARDSFSYRSLQEQL